MAGASMRSPEYLVGRQVKLLCSPREAALDRVPNPQPDTDYRARFMAPEFTSLCPITGQPDFAHIVLDYVPANGFSRANPSSFT